MRDVFEYLRTQLGTDVASANLVISGSTSVVVRDGAELTDALKNGQGVLNVLALAGVKSEVDAALVDLFPQTGSGGSADIAAI